jgi:hypothetical protein
MTEGILGGRQATTMLTRTTWTTGTIFMALSLILSIMSSRARAPESVIQVPTPAGQEAPEAVIPGLDGASGTAPAPVDAPTPEAPSN